MTAAPFAARQFAAACLAVLALAAAPAPAAAPAAHGGASPSTCSNWYDTTEHGTAFRSVKDFGAMGDGTTDDTTAIQAAIDHARGSVLQKAPAVVCKNATSNHHHNAISVVLLREITCGWQTCRQAST